MTDKQLLVVDDTLVLIDLPSKANRIPAHTPDGRPIRIVGELAAPQDHDSLIFEEGIE